MSQIVVTPPASAARVAVANPSHSVRPGSLTCTCESTSSGQQRKVTEVDGAVRVKPQVVVPDHLNPMIPNEGGRLPHLITDHHAARPDKQRLAHRATASRSHQKLAALPPPSGGRYSSPTHPS